MSPQAEIQLIAAIVAAACALPGVFLVLRQMSMMSDSITHTILLGIVLAYFLTDDLSSPLLIAGAVLMGVTTVWITEALHQTRLLSEDSSIGIVFPLLFSIAIILITHFAGSVHLDTDSVLLGELAFAPFNRMIAWGHDIGAKALYTTGALLLVNLLYFVTFFKELQLVTFDPLLGAVLGFAPVLVHYSLMSIVSLTTVVAFEAVGSVLVVAFMIGPAVTAFLLTNKLKTMLLLAGSFGAVNAVIGYHLAVLWDVSIAGSMAAVTGLVFFAVFLIAPKRGLVSSIVRRYLQKISFAEKTILFHLYHHEGEECENEEAGIATIRHHMHWEQAFTDRILRRLMNLSLVENMNGVIRLTESGRARSRKDYEELFS